MGGRHRRWYTRQGAGRGRPPADAAGDGSASSPRRLCRDRRPVGRHCRRRRLGNTAIHHLFLRLPCSSWPRRPTCPVRGAVDVKARDIGVRLAPGAWVHLLPSIAGYVGADHVECCWPPAWPPPHTVLAIDIGTTPRCAWPIAADDQPVVRLRPAFEGAHIKFGMRCAGAIERVRIVDGRHSTRRSPVSRPWPVWLGAVGCVAHLRRAGLLDSKAGWQGPGPRGRRRF